MELELPILPVKKLQGWSNPSLPPSPPPISVRVKNIAFGGGGLNQHSYFKNIMQKFQYIKRNIGLISQLLCEYSIDLLTLNN